MNIVHQTETEFGEIRVDNILELLECSGKLSLTLSISCNSNSSFYANIMWSSAGFIISVHEIFMKMIIAMGITVSCASVLFATISIKQSDINGETDEFQHVSHTDYNNIANLAEELSKFMGESLITYLLLHGLELPMELNQIFSRKVTAVLNILLNRGIIFFGLVLGSLASLQVIK